MMIEIAHGSTHKINYTPTQDVGAGVAVDIGSGVIGVTHRDIKANMLGSVSTQSGTVTYRIPLADGAIFARGATVNIDLTTQDAAPGHSTEFGFAAEAADQTAGDTHVLATFNN